MTRGRHRRLFPVLPALLALAGLALAQDEASEMYARAQKSLDRGAYREAAEAFGRMAADYPGHRQAGNALYFQAFSLYRLGDSGSLRRAARALALQADSHRDASMAGDAATLAVRIDQALAGKGDEDAARRMARRAAALAEGEAPAPAHHDAETKIAALNALMQLDPDRALPVLRRVLAKRDRDSAPLRRQAVFIVSQMDDPAALGLLVDAVENDPDDEVRENAVFWLSQVDDEEAIDLLIRILKSPGREALREKAVFALSQHDSPRCGTALRDAVLDPALSEEVRGQAIFWLGQRDDRDVVPFLMSLYGKLSSPELKEKVIFSVSQNDAREGKAWLLGIVRNGSEDVEMRKKALFWAGQQGALTREDLDGLWSGNADREIREQIIFVLSQQGDRAAVDRLIEIARRERDPELRKKAVFWLGQTDDDRALRFLEELINE